MMLLDMNIMLGIAVVSNLFINLIYTSTGATNTRSNTAYRSITSPFPEKEAETPFSCYSFTMTYIEINIF